VVNMTMIGAKTSHRQPRNRVRQALPGLLLAATLAVVAQRVGDLIPLLGAPVAGILLGVALSHFLRRRTMMRPGIDVAAKYVLQISVVLLGAQLSLAQVADVGLSSMPVMMGTLLACLLVAHFVGRWLGVDSDLRTLIGVGTGICGASAIAAVSPVIRARSSTVAYAISTIFCFNIMAVLLFPPLGHVLGLSQEAFGLFAGTAVNDTSSVVAAATTYGSQATDHAVVVKLTRTLMIIPISLALGVTTRSATPTIERRPHLARRTLGLVPWFLIGFLLLAAMKTSGALPQAVEGPLESTSIFLITVALGAIGLSTNFAAIRKAGSRPLLLGGLLWAVVTTTSLLLQSAAS